MTGRTIATALALVLGFVLAGQAYAQEEHYANRPWELNVNAGAHFLDEDILGESDTDFGAGVRIYMNMPSGWGFGGNFSWILSDADLDDDPDVEEDVDVNTYLYSAEVEYTFGSSTQLHPFVGAGVGAATTKLSDVREPFEDSETNLLITVGGGAKWFNRTNDPNWAIRAEVRDNIISTGDQEFGFDVDSKTFHNFEVSAGISLLFGGGM